MANTITLGTYKGFVKDRLDDQDFSDGLLTQFGNAANAEVCSGDAWSFKEQTYNGTIVASDYTYDLAATIPTLQAPIAIQITDPDTGANPLKYMPHEEFFRNTPDPEAATAAHPYNYTLFGNNLIFPADPDQTYTLRLQYIADPTVISDDADTFDIPDSFFELVVLGMYRRALLHNDNFDQAQVILINEYEPQLKKMRQRLLPRQFGELLTMGNGRVPSGYANPYGDGW